MPEPLETRKIKVGQGGRERLAEIVALNQTIFFGLYERPPYSLSHYQDRLSGQEPFICLAEAGGDLVGSSISFPQDDAWYLWVMGVLPECRRQGIASRFLEMNEARAREKGLSKMAAKVYPVSKDMLSLLRQSGWRDIEAGPDGSGAIYLSKFL